MSFEVLCLHTRFRKKCQRAQQECVEHACAQCQDQTGALHMFCDTNESESCLVKAPEKHASESVLVVGELLCTGVQANTERHTGKETRGMCSCWGYKQQRDHLCQRGEETQLPNFNIKEMWFCPCVLVLSASHVVLWFSHAPFPFGMFFAKAWMDGWQSGKPSFTKGEVLHFNLWGKTSRRQDLCEWDGTRNNIQQKHHEPKTTSQHAHNYIRTTCNRLKKRNH